MQSSAFCRANGVEVAQIDLILTRSFSFEVVLFVLECSVCDSGGTACRSGKLCRVSDRKLILTLPLPEIPPMSFDVADRFPMAAPHKQAPPACATQNSLERNSQLQNCRFALVRNLLAAACGHFTSVGRICSSKIGKSGTTVTGVSDIRHNC